MLAGHIFRPLDDGRHSALVFLHGCGGLIHDGDLDERETSWAGELNRLGYAVLMVDSHWPRGIGSTCSLRVTNPDEWMKLMLKREGDAYGALQFLAAQPFVESNRIGLIGWSLGGGVVLLATRSGEWARLNGTGSASFRAAVAFYPALCNDDEQAPGWSNETPLLLLQGASDTWTQAAPCQRLSRTRLHGAPGSTCRFIRAPITLSICRTPRCNCCRYKPVQERCLMSGRIPRRAAMPLRECRRFWPATSQTEPVAARRCAPAIPRG